MHVENNKKIFKTESKRQKELHNTKLHRNYWVKLLIVKKLAKKKQKMASINSDNRKFGQYEIWTTMRLDDFNFDMPIQPFLQWRGEQLEIQKIERL